MVSSVCISELPFALDSTWANDKPSEEYILYFEKNIPEENGVTGFLSRCERRGPGVATGESSMQKAGIARRDRNVTRLSNSSDKC